jgi:hypothetical protein
MFPNVSDLLRRRRQDIKQTQVEYSDEALTADLQRLEGVWEEVQSSRKRNAIYSYLTAVFDLVAMWEGQGDAQRVAGRALCLRLADVKLARDPFAAVIFCTSDPEKVDRRTRSKWSRVLRYAAEYKLPSVSLERFVTKRRGRSPIACWRSRG